MSDEIETRFLRERLKAVMADNEQVIAVRLQAERARIAAWLRAGATEAEGGGFSTGRMWTRTTLRAVADALDAGTDKIELAGMAVQLDAATPRDTITVVANGETVASMTGLDDEDTSA